MAELLTATALSVVLNEGVKKTVNKVDRKIGKKGKTVKKEGKKKGEKKKGGKRKNQGKKEQKKKEEDMKEELKKEEKKEEEKMEEEKVFKSAFPPEQKIYVPPQNGEKREELEEGIIDLTPLIAATPRLYTGDISHLVKAFDIADLPETEITPEEEAAVCHPDAPTIEWPRGLATKVMNQQGHVTPTSSIEGTLSFDSGDSSVTNLSWMDDVPLVALGRGRTSYICSLNEALSYKRDYDNRDLELPPSDETYEGERKKFVYDDHERLNRICTWLFFDTHFPPCPDARDVLPANYKVVNDDDIIDVTESSIETEGLISSPGIRSTWDQRPKFPFSMREANALWVTATGIFRNYGLEFNVNPGVRAFAVGLIRAARLSYNNTLIVLNDAIPQSYQSKMYRPSIHVLLLPIDADDVPVVNSFMEHHLTQSIDFQRACMYSGLCYAFLPLEHQVQTLVGEGKNVTIAHIVATFIHRIVTGQLPVTKIVESPTANRSQRKRRMPQISHSHKSAFRPVIPRTEQFMQKLLATQPAELAIPLQQIQLHVENEVRQVHQLLQELQRQQLAAAAAAAAAAALQN